MGAVLFNMLLTTVLLVADLDRPTRFLYILLRPQWRSWLTRGAVVLIAFTTLVALWFGLEVAAYMKWINRMAMVPWRGPLFFVGAPLAVLTAVYTAFLFAQAEGRDLWQNASLPQHLILQSLVAGTAGLILLLLLRPIPAAEHFHVPAVLMLLLVLDVWFICTGEFGVTHASDTAAAGAHEMHAGRYRHWFWWGGMGLGHVVPVALLFAGHPVLDALAAGAVLVGLYCYEHAFVMAPQEVPNS
jgi:formate-dependent nitrite reductase membrane component NrfD